MDYRGANPPGYDMARAYAQLRTQPVTAADLDDGVWYLVARGIGLQFAFGKAEREPDGSFILHCITVDERNHFDMRPDQFPIGEMLDGEWTKGVFKYPAPAPNVPVVPEVPNNLNNDNAPVAAVGGKRRASKRRTTRHRRKAQRRTYRR